MVILLRLLLFFISTLGVWEILRRITSIHALFLPSLTVAVQTVVLFAAGLLHCLLGGVILLLAAGIVSLVGCAWHDKSFAFLKNYLNIGYLFLVIAGVALFLFLQGKQFHHYDNFSHWGIVVKQMLLTNHFPDLSDELVLFRSYPLGSSVYIYYFSRIVGSQEGTMMFAQTYMMLCAVLPLLIYTGSKRPMQRSRKRHLLVVGCTFLILIFAVNFFFTYNIPLQDLLVDTLLPLTGINALLYCRHYGRGTVNKFALIGTGFYLVQIVQIKNSGWFFAIIIILVLLYGIRSDKKILLRSLTSLAPMAAAILWKVHCMLTFQGATGGKHELSLSYFLRTVNGKSPEEIRNICNSFLKFTVSWTDIWLTAGMAFLVFLLILFFCRHELRLYGRMLTFSLLSFIIYQGFQLGMYLFSMPEEEAVYLAETERYTRTILIAILYLLVLMTIKTVVQTNCFPWGPCIGTIVIAAGLSLYLMLSQGQVTTVFLNTESYGEREWIEDKIREYQIPMGESYCIVPPEADGGYSYFLCKYIFETTQIEVCNPVQPSDLDHVTSSYILFPGGCNEAALKWIQEHYPDQMDEDVIKQSD